MEVTKNVKYLPAGTTQYVVDSKDDVINVDTSLGPVTIILPNIRNNGMFGSGKVFTINDNGYAGTNNITIGAIGNTTNGTTSVPITSDNGTAKCCVSDYSEWFIDVQPAAAGGGGTVVLLIETTYAALSALKSSSGLTKGTFYKMTDRADLGLIIQATSTSDLSIQGSAIFLNPDYQNAILPNYLMSFEGVWNDAIAVIVAGSSVVSWNGIQYVNATGSNGLSNPSIDTTNWTVITKATSPQLYVQETDYVTYDFDNDFLFCRKDKRENAVFNYNKNGSQSTINIDNFQWGNDIVYGNTVTAFADDSVGIRMINQRGTFFNNEIGGLGGNFDILETFTGIFSNCIVKNAATGVVLNSTEVHTNKTCLSGFSNFEFDLSMLDAVIYSSNILTIPTTLSYIGIFRLDGNSGAQIDKILNGPINHKFRFAPHSGMSYGFNHISVSSPVLHCLLSDAATVNTIVGRFNDSKSDYIEYDSDNNYNRRTNIVQLA